MDVIGDMLTRIRNGQKAKLLAVACSYSKFKESVLSVLCSEGYIAGYERVPGEVYDQLEIRLKYSSRGAPVIREIARISKPGKRVSCPVRDIKPYRSGLGIHVLSTSKGVVSDKAARALGVGGEVICKVF